MAGGTEPQEQQDRICRDRQGGISVNEDIIVTVVSKSDSAKFYNENGKGVYAVKVNQSSSAGVSEGENYLASFDYYVTEYRIRPATKGARNLKVVCGDGEEFDLSFVISNNVALDESAPAIISAEASAETAAVNEAFEVTVVTSKGTAKVGIFNEKGSGIGKSQLEKVVGDDSITWKFRLSVGSKGNRVLSVKAADDFGNWSEEAKSLEIKITK